MLTRLGKLRAKVNKVRVQEIHNMNFESDKKTFLTANDMAEEWINAEAEQLALENEEDKERGIEEMLNDIESMKKQMTEFDELEDLRRRIARTRKGINEYTTNLSSLKANITNVKQKDKTFRRETGFDFRLKKSAS